MTDDDVEVVSFLTLQEDDDLIVSFAIADDEPGEVVSLTLLRTPKYEGLLPAEERGVHVSHEADLKDDEDDRLRRFTLRGSIATIQTARTQYRLDVSDVGRESLLAAQRILKKMNFDQAFHFDLG